MAKRSTFHEFDLYGMVGTGATKELAKADAGRKITEALAGDYYPRIIRFPAGLIGFVYRTLRGWQYTILRPEVDTSRGSGTVLCDEPTASMAERQLRKHVAQNLIFAVEDDGMSVLLEEKDREEHARYIQWQRDYRDAADLGYDDPDCRRIASGLRPVGERHFHLSAAVAN